MCHGRRLLIAFLLLLVSSAAAAETTISTVAGDGTSDSGGDGGAATSAQIFHPAGVEVDESENLFIADLLGNKIRKVTSGGIISTVAGTGASGSGGDGGAATSAQLTSPHGTTHDASGNFYIADATNNKVRKVDATGKISTVAGTGTAGSSGDGGSATAAQINDPRSVAVDSSGNLFIAEFSGHRVRKVDGSGNISTVAGTGTAGYSGDGGAATAAQLNQPRGVSIDSSGNLLIADSGNHAIRKVGATGTISTIAGTGTAGFSGDGGTATSAQLQNPRSVIDDGLGNLFIADTSNHRVRMIDDGIISTIAGTGTEGFSGDGGASTSAQLAAPVGVAADGEGNLYIADFSNNRVRKVTGLPSGGTGNGTGDDGDDSGTGGTTPSNGNGGTGGGCALVSDLSTLTQP